MTGENESRPSRLYILVIAILVCVAMLLGCAEPITGEVSGAVFSDADHLYPVGSVSVTLLQGDGTLVSSVTTKADGSFDFGTQVGGDYKVVIGATAAYGGYDSGVFTLTAAGKDLTVTLSSIPSGNIPSPSPF